jgi:hypothetical protein
VLHAAVIAADHDVLGLEVAVHDVEVVRHLKAGRDVAHEPHDFVQREGAEPDGAVRQELPPPTVSRGAGAMFIVCRWTSLDPSRVQKRASAG